MSSAAALQPLLAEASATLEKTYGAYLIGTCLSLVYVRRAVLLGILTNLACAMLGSTASAFSSFIVMCASILRIRHSSALWYVPKLSWVKCG